MNRNALEVLSNLLLSFPDIAFNILDNQEFYGELTPSELFGHMSLEHTLDPLGVYAFHIKFEGSWADLSDFLFGEDGDEEYWFIMSDLFENNTALDASRRISYMLEHGVPSEYDETFVVAE